jgi:MFS family permease
VTGEGEDAPVPAPVVHWAFGALLVLASSAIVLVAEIVAARVIAPYVGVTLETFSAVIGCVLAGISLGSWSGGWLADRVPPRFLLTGAFAMGGATLIASPYVVRVIGPRVTPSSPSGAVLLAAGAFLLPSIALSAVTPTVLKAIGQGSRRLGSVAGSVSAIGTAGALIGNFGAGFVLVGTLRSGQILVLAGALCLALAGIAALVLGRSAAAPGRAVAAIVLLVGAVGGSQLGRQLPCDTETKYVCLNIDERSPGKFLIRSNIYASSLTDVTNPKSLAFDYVRDAVTVVETAVGRAQSGLAFGYVGGGGYTLPLYFEAAYPDSSHVVYEIDGELVETVTRVLGITDRQARFPTRIGDARVKVATSDPHTIDVVIGDAFSGRAVPWHLTTSEFLEDISTLMTTDGLYVMNLIDYGHYDLARAEARTFRTVFPDVAVVAPKYVLTDASRLGANILLVGGRALPSVKDLNAALTRAHSHAVAVNGKSLTAFIGHETVLTDDFAPVDQLLGHP